MKRALLLLLAACCGQTAFVIADEAPAASKAPVPGGFSAPALIPAWLVPQMPVFNSWSDLNLRVWWTTTSPDERKKIETLPPGTVELEFRRAGDTERVARFSYRIDLLLNGGVSGQGAYDKKAAGLLAALPPGEYQAALLMNGDRASDVATFRIDPAFSPVYSPMLKLGYIEPCPGEKSGRLALWVMGPTPADPSLFGPSDPATWRHLYNMLVDNKVISPGMGGGSGPGEKMLSSGENYLIFGPGDSFPGIPRGVYLKNDGTVSNMGDFDPGLIHTYQFTYHDPDHLSNSAGTTSRTYESAPFRVDPTTHPSNDAWDAATPTIKDLSASSAISPNGITAGSRAHASASQ